MNTVLTGSDSTEGKSKQELRAKGMDRVQRPRAHQILMDVQTETFLYMQQLWFGGTIVFIWSYIWGRPKN